MSSFTEQERESFLANFGRKYEETDAIIDEKIKNVVR
jgi:hypothetical protein